MARRRIIVHPPKPDYVMPEAQTREINWIKVQLADLRDDLNYYMDMVEAIDNQREAQGGLVQALEEDYYRYYSNANEHYERIHQLTEDLNFWESYRG